MCNPTLSSSRGRGDDAGLEQAGCRRESLLHHQECDDEGQVRSGNCVCCFFNNLQQHLLELGVFDTLVAIAAAM